MSQFIESICSLDGVFLNLEWHQKRVNRTFLKHFEQKPFVLKDVLSDQAFLPGKHKFRIIYNTEIESIDSHPYVSKNVFSLKTVESETLDYTFKYHNRAELDSLFEKREHADDIIILKNGLVTDSYYANLAFFDGVAWYTSKAPLLDGTKRQKLLSEGMLKERVIKAEDIHNYKKISLINAMLDLSEVELTITSESIF